MNACAFNKGNHCSILSEKKCNGCAFMKTEKQLAERRDKAWERINTLPEKVRAKINQKYYKKAVKEGSV